MAIGGGTIASLIVRIGGDITQLGKSLKDAEGQISGFVAKTEEAGLALGRLGLIAGGVGAALAAALTLSVRSAGAAQAAQEKLSNAILSSGKAIDQARLERIATELQRITKFSDEAILSMQSLLVTFGATEKQVVRLTPLLLDISERLGIDLETTARTFGKALQGNENALRRLGIGVDQGIDLLGNFEGSVAKLERRFQGAARSAGTTFFGSLSRLRNAFSELQESIGEPILVPLSQLVNAFANVVQAVAGFLKQHPLLSAAIGGIIASFAALLLTVGALAAVMSVRAPFIAAIQLMTAIIPKAGLAITVLNKQLVILAANTRLVSIALQAGAIGAIIAVTIAIIRWVRANDSLNESVTEAFLKIALFAAQVRGDQQAIQTYAQAIEDLRASSINAKKPIRDMVDANAEAERSFEEVAAAARLFRLEIEKIAAQDASEALKKPGLTEQDIKAIEQRRVRASRAANEREVQDKISALKRQLAGVEANSVAEKSIKEKLAVEEAALAQLRLQNDQEVAAESVAAEKRAAEQRIEVERQGIIQELDLRRQALDDESKLDVLRETSRAAAIQRRVSQLKLEEELRIGMLRKTADLERRLAIDVIDTRQTLLTVQQLRLEAEVKRNAAQRAEQVRQGFLTEEQARDQAAEEQATLERQRIAGELQLLKARERQVAEQFEREKGIALTNLQSKLVVLNNEVEAQKAALDSQQRLREIDLAASVKIGRAETEAKIVELNLQLQARLKAVEAEIAAKERAGLVEPGTLAALQEELQGVQAEFEQATQAIRAAQAQRAAAVSDVISETRAETQAQRDALDKQRAVQGDMLRQQFAEDLVNAVQNRNVNLRQLAEDSARLGVDVAGLVADQRQQIDNMFERGEITPEERQRRISFLDGLNDEINALTTSATRQLKTALTESEGLYTKFADAVKRQLQPVADLIREISNPASLANLITAMFATSNLRPAAAGAQVGAAPSITQQNSFTFSGLTLTLTADEQKVLERVIKKLLGPDGERLFTIFQSAQAGPRP